MYRSQELEDHYIIWMQCLHLIFQRVLPNCFAFSFASCFLASSKMLDLKTEAEDPKNQETSLDQYVLPTVNLGIV